MSDLNIQRQQELFAEALTLSSLSERRAFLDRACAGDDALRAELDALLHAHATIKGFLPLTEAGKRTTSEPIAETVGTRIGPYKLLQLIGEGGMGVVYMAQQESPVQRMVALKVIKPGMDTRTIIARLEAERQALALMDHPHIAKMLEAGTTDSGRPYFVMELVRGVPITEYCDKNKLSARDRLSLFIPVCQAIQHAHQKGIIHRDIKPSNVLVTLNDGVPHPMVIDFGIAKALHQRLTDKTLFTQFAQMIGTPAYMSPEQAEMSKLDVDTRTDVYSLGVLLYELLTGTTPFGAQELLSAGLGEMQRIILERDPPKPSTRLSTMNGAERTVVASNRKAEASALDRLLRGDLDWIVMKCLEKDRTRRYETPNALCADIQHHLLDEEIVARPPSVLYRLEKVVRRHKVAVAASAAVVTALLLGTAISTWQAVRAIEAERAAKNARTAEARERSKAEAERDQAQAETARAEEEKAAAERNAYANAMLVARTDWENANFPRLAQILQKTSSYREKGFEWFYWERMRHLALVTLGEHDAPVTAVCFSPDGSRIASGSKDHTVQIWSATDGRLLHTLREPTDQVLSVAFSRDGRNLVAAARDGHVRIWEAANGTLISTFSGLAGALAPNGKSLLVAGEHLQLKLFEMATGGKSATLDQVECNVTSLAFSSEGTELLLTSADGTLQLRDQRQLLWSLESPNDAFGRPAAFSWDSRQVVTGGRDRLVRILDVESGKELRRIAGHGDRVTAVAFSPDGQTVAAGSRDSTIRLWTSTSGAELASLNGHSDQINSIAFSPDGSRLVSASEDRTVMIWDIRPSAIPRQDQSESARPLLSRLSGAARRIPHPSSNTLRFSPDGRYLLASCLDGSARLLDATTLQETMLLKGHSGPLAHANFSPDSTRISTGGHDATLRLWDASSGKELRVWRGTWGNVYWSKLSRDGTRLASATEDGYIRVWDASTGEKLHEWKAHDRSAWALEFYRDEQRLISSGADGPLKVWDLSTGSLLREMQGHAGAVVPLAFSPDAKRIVTGGEDRTIRLWDAATGHEQIVMPGHTAQIWDVLFSPDGERLVSTAHDKTLRVWDAATGSELLVLRGSLDQVHTATFSPDGTRIVAGGGQPFLEVWEAARPDEVKLWEEQEKNAERRWNDWDQREAVRRTTTKAELIKSWLILAPLPLGDISGWGTVLGEEQIPGESNLRPRPGDTVQVGSRTLRWKEAQFDDGIIDFSKFAEGNEQFSAAAYAVTYVQSPVARRGLRLKVGSDDASRVYLNGRLLYHYPLGGNLEIDHDTVLGADLAEGLNVIVFKVLNGSGAWQAALRFVDSEGRPVRNLGL